jgi:hypothetical protein
MPTYSANKITIRIYIPFDDNTMLQYKVEWMVLEPVSDV